MRAFAVVVLGTLMVSCTPTTTELDPEGALERRESPGDTIELAVGSVVAVPGTGLTIRLREVAEDTRCPVDLDCIWEGNARAILVTLIDGVEQVHIVNSSPADWLEGSTRVDAGPHTISFASLLPQPRDGLIIPQEDYRLTVLLSDAPD